MSTPAIAPSNGAAAPADAPAPPADGPAEGLKCANGCGKKASTLACPKCKELGVPGQFFCSQLCFAKNYVLHNKKKHAPKPQPAYNFPPGTSDPFKSIKSHKYTGPLRAVYPDERVPMRKVPEHIPRPDYATDSELLSTTQQRWSGVWGGRAFAKAEEVARTIAYGLRDAANGSEKQGRVLDAEQIEGMRKVCRYAREVLDIAAAAIRPGVTTLEIDEIVHAECLKRDSYPSPLGYHLFPRSVCTSVNEVICHGIPDARPLEDGDILNLDVTLYHGGFHGDINGTYPVGSSVSQVNLDVIACARECLDESIRMCKPGTRYQDIGAKVEEIAKAHGFQSNKTYCGHGINQLFHCMPNIPHYAGNRATGTMKPGQTFTIEPMICVGQQKEVHWPDNWTAATIDGKASAQFEETLLITETGVEVLTAAPGWTLPGKKAEPVAAKGQDGAAKPAGDGAEKKKKNKKKKKAGAAAGAVTAVAEPAADADSAPAATE
ncbi:peptidase M24, structural domain-containing protein [Rhodotorula diobovata]|uniref:Methionine aminopeptidase n=1 Tax=Rhodotorula diobovata TaxID=5288 RepID=A0A5C5FJT7_9BASI|nr:peptidase M24, structural domain-containing protein [Rhodotorula diobovata]